MATLKCKNCGYGIHYNAEPSGIEFVFIKKDNFQMIINEHFDSEKKEIDEQGKYPKLFRTDTIEEDFSDMILKVWKCPECDSLYRFDDSGNVISTFLKADEAKLDQDYTEGIVFDDHLWSKITDVAKPVAMLRDVMPTFFVRIYQDKIVASKDSGFKDNIWFIKQ